MFQQPANHKLRQKIGGDRQPRHKTVLDELDKILLRAHKPFEHPYQYGEALFDLLMKNALFRKGGDGLVGKPSQSYLYRICSVMKVAKYSSNWIAKTSKDGAVDEMWEELEFAFATRNDWIPLKRFAQGHLSGPREFTWWTSIEILTSDVMYQIHRLGIPNTWIPKYALILRCPVEIVLKSDVCRVPTVIDGFEAEIFHPTRDGDVPPPQHGITISLCDPLNLTKGVEEYILKPLPVEIIDYRPLLVGEYLRKGRPLQMDESVRTALKVYYDKLSAT